MASARKRIQELYQGRAAAAREMVEDGEDWEETALEEEEAVSGKVLAIDDAATAAPARVPDGETGQLLARSRGLLDKMHADDREEAITIHERIEAAVESGDAKELRQAAGALRELLFFVEGQSR